jgi:hypothetical protein
MRFLITSSIIFFTVGLGLYAQGEKILLNPKEEEALKELLKIEKIVFEDSTQNYIRIYESRKNRIIVTLRYYDEVYNFLSTADGSYLLSIRHYKKSSFKYRKKTKRNMSNMLFDLTQIAKLR